MPCRACDPAFVTESMAMARTPRASAIFSFKQPSSFKTPAWEASQQVAFVNRPHCLLQLALRRNMRPKPHRAARPWQRELQQLLHGHHPRWTRWSHHPQVHEVHEVRPMPCKASRPIWGPDPAERQSISNLIHRCRLTSDMTTNFIHVLRLRHTTDAAVILAATGSDVLIWPSQGQTLLVNQESPKIINDVSR